MEREQKKIILIASAFSFDIRLGQKKPNSFACSFLQHAFIQHNLEKKKKLIEKLADRNDLKYFQETQKLTVSMNQFKFKAIT